MLKMSISLINIYILIIEKIIDWRLIYKCNEGDSGVGLLFVFLFNLFIMGS